MSQALSMPRWKIWIHAARPPTLIATISPVVIGTLFAFKQGAFNPLLFLFTMLSALCIQIGTNFANDYFDLQKGADTSERLGPLKVTQAGLISKEEIRKGFIAIFALSALSSIYLIWHGGVIIAALACISILLGIIYTAGPYPIAYLGLAELFVFIFYGPIATAATAFLQTNVFSLNALLLGLAPGALSNCILIIGNLRDVVQDAKANKKTLIVRFGKSFGLFECIFFLFLAMATPIFFWKTFPFTLVATIILLIPAVFLALSLVRVQQPNQYNLLFKRCALLLVFYTLLFCLGLLA